MDDRYAPLIFRNACVPLGGDCGRISKLGVNPEGKIQSKRGKMKKECYIEKKNMKEWN